MSERDFYDQMNVIDRHAETQYAQNTGKAVDSIVDQVLRTGHADGALAQKLFESSYPKADTSGFPHVQSDTVKYLDGSSFSVNINDGKGQIYFDEKGVGICARQPGADRIDRVQEAYNCMGDKHGSVVEESSTFDTGSGKVFTSQSSHTVISGVDLGQRDNRVSSRYSPTPDLLLHSESSSGAETFAIEHAIAGSNGVSNRLVFKNRAAHSSEFSLQAVQRVSADGKVFEKAIEWQPVVRLK